MDKTNRRRIDRMMTEVAPVVRPVSYWFMPTDDDSGDVEHVGTGTRYSPADLEALRRTGARVNHWIVVTPNHPE